MEIFKSQTFGLIEVQNKTIVLNNKSKNGIEIIFKSQYDDVITKEIIGDYDLDSEDILTTLEDLIENCDEFYGIELICSK